MKNVIKPAALVLAVSILFSVASCGINTNKKARKITSDTPWYDAEIFDYMADINPDKPLEDLYHKMAGADDKYIAVFTEGSYKVKAWTDDIKYEDWMIRQVGLVDRQTKQKVKTIDLLDVIGEHETPIFAFYYGGRIVLYSSAWYPSKNEEHDIERIIDVETGETLNTYDYGISDMGYQSPDQYYVGDYRIEVDRPDMFMNSSYYCLRIFSPDGNMKQVDIKDQAEGIYDVPVIFALDENTVLVPAAAARTYKYFKVDLIKGESTPVNADDYSWIDPESFESICFAPDGNTYFTNTSGISKIDLKNKTIEEVINYSSTAINMNYTQRLGIASFSEDTMFLCGRYYSSDSFRSEFISDFVIIELTKAKKNPHAGKTILEMYIPKDGMNAVISDAIIKYNESNKKYFIQVTDKYNAEKYMQSVGISGSQDDYDAQSVNATAKMSYELAMDIMNGEGPDILMNTSALGQINNSNYLEDLSPYVSDLESDKYFTNIIVKAKTDGKLYQLPLSFTIEGIQTDPEYAGKSAAGFTTEEYVKFLGETLNGKDVIDSGQPLYFVKLFSAMSDTFIKDGKVDLSGPEFACLAEFVKNNVHAKSKAWDEDLEGVPDPESEEDPARNRTAYYCSCPGISGYLVKKACMRNATAILGIPSADGRGPMFGTDISVAVSANAVNKEACIEFVKLLMSDEVQHDLAMNDRIVINRTEFRKGCEAAVEYYNSPDGAEGAFDYSIGTTVNLTAKFHDEDIDNIERIILSCSKSDSPDSAINVILMEEMPAYFSGQKDLSAVIKIMQDRMQKVLDERA